MNVDSRIRDFKEGVGQGLRAIEDRVASKVCVWLVESHKQQYTQRAGSTT